MVAFDADYSRIPLHVVDLLGPCSSLGRLFDLDVWMPWDIVIV